VPPGAEGFPFKDNQRPGHLLRREKIATGDSVIGARAGFDQDSGTPNVSISLDGKGGRSMQRTTGEHVGKLMAVLFVESRTVTRNVTNPDGTVSTVLDKVEDKYIINAATIRGVFGSQFQITGLDSPVEAAELALLLRSGALAAPMYFVEERTIGPSLGAANIEAGVKAAVVGFLLVLAFMLIYYRLVGLYGAVALVANLLLLVALLGLFNATLTLPGIAGIVLTLGMAVDANVLINERIKEELRKGMPLQQAISSGYDRAWATIFDSNLTTLLVAVILFAFGTGSVKGFAITLSIGIGTSIFTAVVVSRLLVNWTWGRSTAKSISIQPVWSRA
jgi:preprotein translocase subunit SecD